MTHRKRSREQILCHPTHLRRRRCSRSPSPPHFPQGTHFASEQPKSRLGQRGSVGSNQKSASIKRVRRIRRTMLTALYHCTTVPLYHCTTVSLYHCVLSAAIATAAALPGGRSCRQSGCRTRPHGGA
eukprot:5675721-Pyramimonas_sp.AAC.1